MSGTSTEWEWGWGSGGGWLCGPGADSSGWCDSCNMAGQVFIINQVSFNIIFY